MANLSNINNKFLFTDGDFLKIGNSAPINNVSGTESGISVINSNVASLSLTSTATTGKTYALMSEGPGGFRIRDIDANNDRLIINTSGNVGIGTVSPSGNLSVQSTININDGSNFTNKIAPLVIGDIDGVSNSRVLLLDANQIESNGDSLYLNYNSAQNIILGIGGGNVGIATTSPSAKLMIETGSDEGIRIYRASTNANFGAIEFRNSDDTATNSRIGFGTNYMRIEGTDNLQFITNSAERIRINSSGNVGIGTTSPSSKLTVIDGNNTFETSDGNNYARSTVNGGSVQLGLFRAGSNIGGGYLGADGQTCFHVRDASFATKLYLTQAGSLGIGTTSPTKTLQVNGSIGLTTTATDGNKRIHTYPDDYHSWYYKSSVVNNQSADVMTYYQQFLIRHQDSTDVFIIRGNGNVGIGTTSPNPFGWGNKHLTVLAAGANQYAAVDIIGSGNAAGAILFGGGSGSGTATNIGRAQISAHDGSHLVFATNESNSGSSFTERMRIPNSGGLDMSSGIPTGTHDNMTTFKTSKFTVTSGNSDTATLVPKSAGMSSTGTVYVALENSGNTVRWGYIIDFFYNNSTLNSTIRESGSSQGTTTASITEVNGDIKLTIAYAGGLGGSIRYIAGGHSVNMSWSA